MTKKELSPEDKAEGARIRQGRKALGLSTPEFAKKLDVTHQAVLKWEAGYGMGAKNARKLSQLLQGSAAVPLTESSDGQTLTNVRFDPAQLPNIAALPADVPVLGIAVGGAEGDFRFNGMIVDYVKRPPGIARARDAYAIRLVGSSMEPWGGDGALLYVDPNRPPADGDYVVIQLADGDEGSPGTAMVKRLVGRTPTLLKLTQYNPKKEFTVPLAKVAMTHKVLTLSDLLS